MFEQAKALVEYTATYNGFPIVLSMNAGSGYQIEAILESLKEPGKLQNIQRSFINISTDTLHVYFHLIHSGSVYEGIHAEMAEYAKKRGDMCLNATLVQLVHKGMYPEWLRTGEKIPGWTFASSGATFKGIASDSVMDVLALINQKVSVAKDHPIICDAKYQKEIAQQWQESSKSFGNSG